MVQATVPVPVRIVRQRRLTASPARWQAALDRALEEALDVLIEPVSGEAFIESASTPGTLYAVSRTHCTCPAGLAGDPICKHRACYLAQVGELALPETPAVPEPLPRCSWCSGAGTVEQWGVRGPIGSTSCPDCDGSGLAWPDAAPVVPEPRPTHEPRPIGVVVVRDLDPVA